MSDATSTPIRVLIVDDHVIVRNGLEQLLDATDDYELVGLAGNGREAVELVEQLRPDVVLMDLSMPVMEGVEATSIISEATFLTLVATSMAARWAELPAFTAEREANVPMPSAMLPVSPVTTVTSSKDMPSWSATT